MKKLYLIVAIIFIVALTFYGAARSPLYNILLYGETSGLYWSKQFFVDDSSAASDKWVYGDTADPVLNMARFYTGSTSHSQPIEITDIKVTWDPDSGDSIRVFIYDCGFNDDSLSTAVVYTDTLLGTTWSTEEGPTISTTQKTITPSEGMAILYHYIAGSPNSVRIDVEGRTRQVDIHE
jgi:hypothetical protein